MNDFSRWEREAQRRGWKTPAPTDAMPADAWVRYWEAMHEYERRVKAGDPDPGRPVVPHRSGGAR